MFRRLVKLIVLIPLLFAPWLEADVLASANLPYVRTANYFLMSGSALEDEEALQTLSSFDLLVLPAEAQLYNHDFFGEIRNLNPDIVLLAYIPTVSWNDRYWSDAFHDKLYEGIESDWWLKDADGNQKSVWPGTRALNLNTDWVPYLASFVDEEVMSTDYWDGIFYDEVGDSIDWIGNLDVDLDGKNDTASEANTLWAERYQELFSKTRSLLGSSAIIITNGSSNSAFAPYVNGRMFETFPSSDDSLTEWKTHMKDYLSFENMLTRSPINVINVNTENTGDADDYQNVRFGITSTLLGSGFFAFDYGDENHAQLWTYDEYDAFLGDPKSGPENLLNPESSTISTGIWERDFVNGKVVLNATSTAQTIELDGEYEKLHGDQDPLINNGSIVSTLTLASKDGIILLRPIEELTDAPFLNGSFTRVFNTEGQTKRTGFFAYDASQLGGTFVIHYDLDFDGKRETIAAGNTYVSIYDADGNLLSRFAPYTEAYKDGVNLAVGDLEGDGSVEIVTGTEEGGGPHIRVFNSNGVLINPGFFPYHESFRGGVRVAIGDLNGDGTQEIVCAAGDGGGPHIRVTNKHGKVINPGFFAYDEMYRGGAYVAAGDVNGDGVDEIITGTGKGLEPLVRVFDRDGNLFSEFLGASTSQKNGLQITTSDIDGNGTEEIFAFSTDVFTLSSF